MSKFKPGQMVMLRGCYIPVNNKIVTLVKFVGTPPQDGIAPWGKGSWWEIDQPLKMTLGPPLPYAREISMIPLSDPDLSNDIAKEEHESTSSTSRVPTNHNHA